MAYEEKDDRRPKVHLFDIDPELLQKIAERGDSLTEEEVREIGPVEEHDAEEYFTRIEPKLRALSVTDAIREKRSIPLGPAQSFDDLVPPVLRFPRLVCICVGYEWFLCVDQFGHIRYCLRCKFICFFV